MNSNLQQKYYDSLQFLKYKFLTLIKYINEYIYIIKYSLLVSIS